MGVPLRTVSQSVDTLQAQPDPGVIPPPTNLLGDNPSEKLDIKMNPDGSGQLYVPGLTQITVQCPEDINRVSCPPLSDRSDCITSFIRPLWSQ